jgi:hypothetical protein
MPDPYTCPTLCDTDCEVNGWGCHEAHDVPSHREHDPAGCEGRQLADNLRSLIDAGWKIQFGKHSAGHQGPYALEPYYVTSVAEPMFSRVWHGVSPGDAVARARQAVISEAGEDGKHDRA